MTATPWTRPAASTTPLVDWEDPDGEVAEERDHDHLLPVCNDECRWYETMAQRRASWAGSERLIIAGYCHHQDIGRDPGQPCFPALRAAYAEERDA